MKNRNWRWIAVGIWLLIVLFVGRFSKGIDIAWGVEFVYKIDFTKYRELYKTENEFLTVTQKAKQIIEGNIRKRVNALWVGDSEVKTQKVGWDDYVVVRIGGLDDLAKAREIIGKTVELEFALPNSLTGSVNYEERKKLAENLLGQITKEPGAIKSLGEQGSNDVYYFEVTWALKEQLPPVVRDNLQKVANLSSGTVFPTLLEWLFQTADPLLSGSTDANWFVIVKALWKEAWNASGSLSDQDLLAKAEVQWYTSTDSFTFEKPFISWDTLAPGVYYDAWSKKILLDLGDPFLAQTAYQIDLYVPGTGGVSGVDKLAFDADLSSLGFVKYVDKKWAWASQLPLLATATGLTKNTLKVVNSDGQDLVLKIYDIKDSSTSLYRSIAIAGVASKEVANTFIQELLSNDKYNMEIVFIRDSNSWIPAQDDQKRVLNGAYFKFASVTRDQVGRPAVQIDLDEVGKDIFCKITQVSIQKQMAIFVGGVLVTAPTIQDKICGGSAIINGDYTVETARQLADDLNEGALPAKLIQINESKVSATLGDNARKGAIWATIISLVLILFLMTRRYGFKKAIIATVGLLSFMIVLIAILKIMWFALSLSGIAAIILNIGMGVDAAILIYERLNEEIRRGRRMKDAIYEAYERAWPAIFGGQMSTIAIGILLVLLGSDLFQGFGMVMTLNIIVLLSISVPLIKQMLLKSAENTEEEVAVVTTKKHKK